MVTITILLPHHPPHHDKIATRCLTARRWSRSKTNPSAHATPARGYRPWSLSSNIQTDPAFAESWRYDNKWCFRPYVLVLYVQTSMLISLFSRQFAKFYDSKAITEVLIVVVVMLRLKDPYISNHTFAFNHKHEWSFEQRWTYMNYDDQIKDRKTETKEIKHFQQIRNEMI